MSSRAITLDATFWSTPNDVYEALLSALGAPSWHGRNLDAIWDSVRGDDINTIRAPYRIQVTSLNAAPRTVSDFVGDLEVLFNDARAYGVDVGLSIVRARCPVCRLPLTYEPWNQDSPSHEICPCCGIQFGLDDDTPGGEPARARIHRRLRDRWIGNGMQWWSPTPPPPGWDPIKQLESM